MELDQKKIARYDQQALWNIQKQEDEYIARIKVETAAKQWCLKAGVDIELINYSHKGVVEFRTYTFEADGRMNDVEVADLCKKLKKAPFKYTISGIK